MQYNRTLLSVSFPCFGSGYQVIILKLTEPSLVNKLFSLIDQNICVPIFRSTL